MPGDAYLKEGDFIHNNNVAPADPGSVLPLFQLTGRTAIISGAGAGIGLAIAQALAEAGCNVAIWYNSNKKAIDEAAKIEKKYGVKCEHPAYYRAWVMGHHGVAWHQDISPKILYPSLHPSLHPRCLQLPLAQA